MSTADVVAAYMLRQGEAKGMATYSSGMYGAPKKPKDKDKDKGRWEEKGDMSLKAAMSLVDTMMSSGRAGVMESLRQMKRPDVIRMAAMMHGADEAVIAKFAGDMMRKNESTPGYGQADRDAARDQLKAIFESARMPSRRGMMSGERAW